ncbi:hypothetical protein F5X68DRAFT_262736 [Plectosphaerella plurivora]|uniref:Uncharacterized protein n=1 Tax=Plectosphaerella plurivora TaxID=936078 RepID=A0A9P9A8R0_9PEZI|nr:hypothetical protein F5X68DRAFT_262736 [Plectosphaerella plurivora]
MSDDNVFISNGTCYLAAGVEAHKAMIPCGNAVFYGDLTCCQQGDVCLTSNACYNQEFGVTYLAGCSDPKYKAASCPDKGAFEDEPWVGLVYCNGTSNEWTACAQSASSDTLAPADHCWCPEEPRTVAFNAPSVLNNTVQLGTALLESVIYSPGYAPTLVRSDGATAATAPPASTTDLPSTETSPTTPTPTSALVETSSSSDNAEQGQGLPSEVGIGIGVGVGSAIVILLAGLLFFLRRRRRRQREADRDLTAASEAAEKPSAAAVDSLPPPPSLGTPELESRAARPWSMRSELPDTPRSVAAEMESPVQASTSAHGTAQHGRPPAAHPSLTGRSHNGLIAELP